MLSAMQVWVAKQNTEKASKKGCNLEHK
jgi:hypothetical protein